MTRALVIGLDGTMRDEHVDGLDDLCALVGGPIQALDVPAWDQSENVTVGKPVGPHTLYVNEESKVRDDQPRLNVVADGLMVCRLQPGDYVAGVAVAVGFDPATGEDVDHSLDPVDVLADAEASASAWSAVSSDREVMGRSYAANRELGAEGADTDALGAVARVYALELLSRL